MDSYLLNKPGFWFQNPSPPVCGLLGLMRQELDHSGPGAHLRPGDTCFYLRLEHTPTWAQQNAQHSQESFTRSPSVCVSVCVCLLVDVWVHLCVCLCECGCVWL